MKPRAAHKILPLAHACLTSLIISRDSAAGEIFALVAASHFFYVGCPPSLGTPLSKPLSALQTPHRKMTIWDGHGRTPHDALENFLSVGAMILCMPCLCVVACRKIGKKENGKSTELQSDLQSDSPPPKATEMRSTEE